MSKRILIVDDEQTVRDAIQLILDLKGYSTLTAKNGSECLEVLGQQEVDLILLDIMMPEMDGWEVLRQLKDQGKADLVPVVILSAKTQSIDKMLGLKVFGVKDYITKPFAKDDLVGRVERAMQTF
ncbi:MAG: response regulator [bacterium]|nr:response regulator [bacterium]